MDKYLVSVIIPCFNAEKYIDTCMQSVMSSYFDGLQVVIINNGSTDNTLSKCNEYKKKYSFVTVVDQENKGHCGSKNSGIDHAQGKYLMFIDVDDEFYPGAIKKTIKKIEDEQADILCFGYKQTTEKNGVIVKEKDYIPTEDYYCLSNEDVFNKIFYSIFGIPISEIKHWYEGNKLDRHKRFSSLWCHVYKRSIVEELQLRVNPELQMYEDGIFNCLYLLSANKACYIPECLYLYKKVDTGITMTKYDSAKQDLKLPLLQERNRLRRKVLEEKGIDILEWYAGSNVLSIFQMMQNYAIAGYGKQALKEIETYIKVPEVEESIKMYPVGGELKKAVPAFFLKHGWYKTLYRVVVLINKIGIKIDV